MPVYRSKGLGNKTLKELWQREQWMSRKRKGLVACSSSHCTDSVADVWEWILIVLASPLPGRGMNSLLQHLTQETQPEPMGWAVNGSRVWHTAVSACTHCSSSLLSWEFIPSLLCIFTYKKILWSACIKYLMIHIQVVPLSYVFYCNNKLYSVLSCVILKDI